MLTRYRSDPSHIISPETIELQPDLTYEEEPVEILARETKKLRSKTISLVKVLKRQLEETMREQYPHLFTDRKSVV